MNPLKRPSSRALLAILAAAAVAAPAWYWNNAASSRRVEADQASFSNSGLTEMRILEKIHFRRHGRYAASLEELAAVSSDPEGFLKGMKVLFEEVRITRTESGYRIAGRATDPAKTPVSFTGP